MTPEAQKAISGIDSAMKSIERRLMAESSDYRLFKSLEKAKADLMSAAAAAVLPVASVAGTAPIPASATPDPEDHPVEGSFNRPLTQGDAAERALREANRPLYIYDLLKRVRAFGVTVSGERPHINLSSMLSRDKRFQNLKYNGQYCWWLKDRADPVESDALKELEGVLS